MVRMLKSSDGKWFHIQTTETHYIVKKVTQKKPDVLEVSEGLSIPHKDFIKFVNAILTMPQDREAMPETGMG